MYDANAKNPNLLQEAWTLYGFVKGEAGDVISMFTIHMNSVSAYKALYWVAFLSLYSKGGSLIILVLALTIFRVREWKKNALKEFFFSFSLE